MNPTDVSASMTLKMQSTLRSKLPFDNLDLILTTCLRQDRLFSAYNELLRYYPFLQKIFQSQSNPHQLGTIYAHVSFLKYIILSG